MVCPNFQHAPEQFGNAPRLCQTAAGALRRVPVEDFGNLANALVFDVPAEFRQPLCRLLARRGLSAINFEIRQTCSARSAQVLPPMTLG
jgi:hypothetical protein